MSVLISHKDEVWAGELAYTTHVRKLQDATGISGGWRSWADLTSFERSAWIESAKAAIEAYVQLRCASPMF